LIVPLLSPQGWDYVLILGLPAVMLMVDRFPEVPLPWKVVVVLAFATTNFLVFDLYRRTIYAMLTDAHVATYGALALVATVVWLRFRRFA